MKIWKATLLACFLVCLKNNVSHAGELLFSKAGQEKPITMSGLKQGQDLLLFWREDCAPCLVELGLLPEISKEFPNLKILLVSLQDKELSKKHLPPDLHNITQSVARSDAKVILQAFGNEKLVLPYSVVLRRDGSICDKNYGILSKSKIKKWIKTCSMS